MTAEDIKELKKIKGYLGDIEDALDMSNIRNNDRHTYDECMSSIEDIETIIRKLCRR